MNVGLIRAVHTAEYTYRYGSPWEEGDLQDDDVRPCTTISFNNDAFFEVQETVEQIAAWLGVPAVTA